MLESNHWIQQYFSEATDAVLIFKDDQLVISNQLARDLQAELNFDPNYLVQIADNGSSKNSIQLTIVLTASFVT